MADARTLAPPTIVAGAFDAFANAWAAAADLLTSGFAAHGVRITSNPANPDGAPGSVAAEIATMPGVWQRLLANLLANDAASRRDGHDVRSGGVVVSVPVTVEADRVLARNIMQLHRGVDLDCVARGVPIY